MSAELFNRLGLQFARHTGQSKVVEQKKFKSFFGVSPFICARVWASIQSHLGNGFKEVHLLWGLFFLRNYPTESIACGLAMCDAKTYRKRIWRVVEELAQIDVVGFPFFIFGF